MGFLYTQWPVYMDEMKQFLIGSMEKNGLPANDIVVNTLLMDLNSKADNVTPPEKSPFPLIQSIEDVHTHIDFLMTHLPTSPATKAETCQNILANLYHCSDWDMFMEQMTVFEDVINKTIFKLKPPQLQTKWLEGFGLLEQPGRMLCPLQFRTSIENLIANSDEDDEFQEGGENECVQLCYPCKLEIDNELVPVHLWISMEFALCEFSLEEAGFQCWNFSALFVDTREEEAVSPVIAGIDGYLVIPVLGDMHINEDDFYYAMDSESAQFNDIAKVIIHQISREDHEDFLDFVLEDPYCRGIMVPFPAIRPDLRGKGLLAPIIDQLNRAFDAAPRNVVAHSLSNPLLFDRDEFNDPEFASSCTTIDGQPCPSPWFGGVHTVLFQVAGTFREGSAEEFHVGFFKNATTVPAKMTLDLEAEKRKKNLNKHFLSLPVSHGTRLKSYDPYDYPWS